MLKFNNISYSYGNKIQALHDVCATVRPGICLMLGENGAGKTTLLKLAAGNLTTGQGEIDFDGSNPGERHPDTLSRIFFLPDNYRTPFRNVLDMAEYHAPFYPRFDAGMLAENLAAFGMTGREKVKPLSLGNSHKAYLAFALALRPALLLLDEPANGLDIQSKKILRQIMSRCIAEDQTVVVSTHTVADLELLYDSVMLLSHGHMVLQATTEEISSRLSFFAGSEAVPGALYSEAGGGQIFSVVPAAEPYQTAVNFELLYSALMSERAGQVLDVLK